jgi:hypothetical protein
VRGRLQRPTVGLPTMTAMHRSMRRYPSLVWALGLMVVAETSAFAQPPATGPAARGNPAASATTAAVPLPLGDALTGEAKDDYEAGRGLFLHGDYAGALVKFQRAFDVSSDTRLLWNVGSCELNLKHYVRVLRLIERYLQEGGAGISDEQREEAEAMLRKIRPLVSAVRLTVNVPGAAVFVDDQPAGTTPLTDPLLLDLGDRHIKVTKRGFQEQVVVQHVTGEADATLSVTLEAEVHRGGLSIVSDSSASISVDGAVVGVGRWDGALAPGRHEVRVRAASMRPYDSEVDLRDGEQRTLDVELVKASGGSSAWLWIGGTIVAAAGLGAGAYFLFRPSPSAGPPTSGTISPYTLTVQQP